MSNGWTPERRARQAALIRTWKPWCQSTGPRSAEGKARAAQNGFKGARWRVLQALTKEMNALMREQRKTACSVQTGCRMDLFATQVSTTDAALEP